MLFIQEEIIFHSLTIGKSGWFSQARQGSYDGSGSDDDEYSGLYPNHPNFHADDRYQNVCLGKFNLAGFIFYFFWYIHKTVQSKRL